MTCHMYHLSPYVECYTSRDPTSYVGAIFLKLYFIVIFGISRLCFGTFNLDYAETRIGQGQPRVIIYTNFVELESANATCKVVKS